MAVGVGSGGAAGPDGHGDGTVEAQAEDVALGFCQRAVGELDDGLLAGSGEVYGGQCSVVVDFLADAAAEGVVAVAYGGRALGDGRQLVGVIEVQRMGADA